MTDWDAILGEAALGLDLAKIDLVPGGPGQESARHRKRPSVATQLHPSPGRPAELAATNSGAKPAVYGVRPVQATRSSLTLAPRPPPPTRGLDAIFRQEALEFRARGRDTPGSVVRLGSRWTRWAYRMLLVLIVAAVTSMWVIYTDESSSGPAVLDGRTGAVAVLLPAAVGPDLTSSLTITLPGGRSVRISGLRAQLADDTAISKAGLAPLTQPAILLTGQLNLSADAASLTQDAHLRYQATVVLGSESLAEVLAGQFGVMLGTGTSQ